ncbi:MAG: type IV toxin-antitoxin system AbiEi family antitoxin domain-containing protein [Gemmatimonadota bacterium]
MLLSLASEDKNIFTIQDAYRQWKDDPNTPSRLHTLEVKGWLERLERGKYLIIPFEAGPERQWTEDAYVLASYLIDPSAIAYWSALHHWNMTEQVPRVTYVQSTSRKFTSRKEVLGIRFRFVKVASRKFFGLHRQHVDHKRYSVTDREKTLLDCLDRPDLAGGIPEVSKALLASPSLDWIRIDEYLKRFGSGAVVKRLGFLVDSMHVDVLEHDERLMRWQEWLTAGLSKLDPSSPRQSHRIETRWRVRVNVDEEVFRGRA